MNRGNSRGHRYSRPPVEDLRITLNRIRERDQHKSEGSSSYDHPGNFLRDPERDGGLHEHRRDDFTHGRGRGDYRSNETHGHFRGDDFSHVRGRGDYRNNETHGYFRGRGRGNLNRGNSNFSPRGNTDFSPRGNPDFSSRGNPDFSPRGNSDFSPRGNSDLSPRGKGRGYKYEQENYGRQGGFRGRGYNKPFNVGQHEWNKGVPINIHVEVESESGVRSCNMNDAATFSNNITPRRGNYRGRRSSGRSFRGRGRGKSTSVAENVEKNEDNASSEGNTETSNVTDENTKKDTNENNCEKEVVTNEENEEYLGDEEGQEYLEEDYHEHNVVEDEENKDSNPVEDLEIQNEEKGDSLHNNNSDKINKDDEKLEMLEEDLKKIVITKPNDKMV